jgi:hypothetical protein
MKPIIDIGISKSSLQSWEKRIERLFNDLEQSLQDPAKFNREVNKTQKGLQENREMDIENELRYAEMKYSLKQRGLIKESTPLSVTGQLIKDFHLKLMKTDPNELTHILTFKNDPRMRPTYESMAAVYRGDEDALRYKQSGSQDIVKVLQTHKGYPIIETIYKVYSKDYVKRVERIINDVFTRSKNGSGN